MPGGIGFQPKFCGKGREGIKFQLVVYTRCRSARKRRNAVMYKTIFPHHLVIEDVVKRQGYDTDRMIAWAMAQRYGEGEQKSGKVNV